MVEDSDSPEQLSLYPDSISQRETKKTKIYFDTNQLYYIRRIAEEAQGSEFGEYGWAYRLFPQNLALVQDIRALCYIVALEYEWELVFSSSDAAFTEVNLSNSQRAQATRDAWILFTEGLKDEHALRLVPLLPDWRVSGHLSLDFIDDQSDKVILRHFASVGADVLLTSDDDILRHKEKLAKLNLTVMRPHEWLNDFLKELRNGEDAADYLERILFGIGKSR
jgi:hypothetical protein